MQAPTAFSNYLTSTILITDALPMRCSATMESPTALYCIFFARSIAACAEQAAASLVLNYELACLDPPEGSHEAASQHAYMSRANAHVQQYMRSSPCAPAGQCRSATRKAGRHDMQELIE